MAAHRLQRIWGLRDLLGARSTLVPELQWSAGCATVAAPGGAAPGDEVPPPEQAPWGGLPCSSGGSAAPAALPLCRPRLDDPRQAWWGLAPARGYAKPAKGKGGGGGKKGGGAPAAAATEEGGDAAQEPEFDPAEVESAMAAAIEHLAHELAGVRTGRANPGLLENIPVDAYGEKLPLKACGAVTVRNPQLLAVSVFDAGLVSAVVKAIQNSPLSLSPAAEGSDVLVKLPRMTKDTIEQMVKLVHMEVEGAHQSIRRARQRGMDAVKKAFKGASEDDRRRAEKEVQRLHDKYLAEADGLRKAKDAELREHRD